MYVITCVCVGVTSEQDILSRAHYKLMASPEKNVGRWTWWKAHLKKKIMMGRVLGRNQKSFQFLNLCMGGPSKKTEISVWGIMKSLKHQSGVLW